MLLLLLFTHGQLRGHQRRAPSIADRSHVHPRWWLHPAQVCGDGLKLEVDPQGEQLENCYDNNEWDKSACPDVATCSKNCAIEGIAADKYNEPMVHTDGEESTGLLTRPAMRVAVSTYSTTPLRIRASTSITVSLHSTSTSQPPMRCQWRRLLCSNGCRWRQEAFAGKNEAGAEYGTGYCDARVRKMSSLSTASRTCSIGAIPCAPNSGGKYGSCCGARCGSKQPRDRLHRASAARRKAASSGARTRATAARSPPA